MGILKKAGKMLVLTQKQFNRMRKAGHRSLFEANNARFGIACRKRRAELATMERRAIKPVFES